MIVDRDKFQKFQEQSSAVFDGAAVGEQFITIQWAKDNNCKLSKIAFYLSTTIKSEQSIKALELAGHALTENTSDIAAKEDDIDALNFLYSSTKCPLGKEALFAYARNGVLDMVLTLTKSGNLSFG